MKEIIKTICLILITLAVLVGIGFYCWSIYQEQSFYKKREECRLNCLNIKDTGMSGTKKIDACKMLCDYLPILPNSFE